MAGISDMREAQPIYTDYHTLRDFVTAFPLSLLLNAKWSSPHKFFRRFCFTFCFQVWFLEAWIGFEVWVFSVHAVLVHYMRRCSLRVAARSPDLKEPR